jgi:integrase
MARRIRDNVLETRTSRLGNLEISKKPTFVRIGHGIGLGYRRNRTNGTWVVRVADGKGKNWTQAIGSADDHQDANGDTVLDFWQAQDRARSIGRADRADGAPATKPITVAEALDRYGADLQVRGGDAGNVSRVRGHLPVELLERDVARLTARDLRSWRDKLVKVLAPASINRTTTGLKAALNLGADQDERIVNRRAWDTGLATIPDAEVPRNVILDEPLLRRIVAEAANHSTEFGLFVEVAAVTGARVSQLARIEIQDLQTDRSAPRIMMPSSRKGKGKKTVVRRPVPITAGLAGRLRSFAASRPETALLLVKPSGESWKKSDHSRPFARAVMAAGADPERVTIYALRHTNIVRQLLVGVPIRVVAVNHDTSTAMIEKNYSSHIGDHTDALSRAAILDLTENVVPLTA